MTGHAKVIAQPLLEAADLGRDVCRGNAKHHADVVMAQPIEIEHQECLVQLVQPFNGRIQESQIGVRTCVHCLKVAGILENFFTGRDQMLRLCRFTTPPGDCYVQSNPIHPRGELQAGIVARVRLPKV